MNKCLLAVFHRFSTDRIRMNVCVGSKCVLHTVETGSSDGKILTFTPKKLYKCRQILVLRNRHVKSKLFEKITLPDSPDGFQGYHTECYSKFTALPRREWEDIDPRYVFV